MTRLFRSITSLLLCGTLLVVTAPVGASAEEDTVQTISTKAELTQIRQNSSGKYRLTANIEFLPEDFAPGGAFYNNGSGWQPIGNSYNTRFTGELDGNGYTIDGLTVTLNAPTSDSSVYAGLFGYAGGRIENLRMTNTRISVTGGQYVYAGSLVAAGMGTIRACKIENSRIVLTETALTGKAGGIAGRMFSGAIRMCRMSGSIEAQGVAPSVGGLVGQSHAAIEESYCKASIVMQSSSDSYAGGITGASDLQAIGGQSKTSTISQCTASVNISAGAYAGGIVGYFVEGNVEKCRVEGVISTKEIEGQAGGIIGRNKYGGKVTDCYNMASVAASEVAGGIVGYEYTTYLFTISKCWSSGDITAPVVGGIAGYIGFSSIEECYTSGNITGNYAGGIAAYAGSEIIKNCSSTANVVAESEEEEDSFAGGIVGVGLKYSSYQGTSIQNCYATGKISSNYAAGGIAGLNRSDAGSITHCIALNIEGIGEITKDKLSLKASPEVYLGRITVEKQGTLTSNFASPLIPGDWTDEASGKDGDDLTSTNFTQGNGNAFDGWDDTDVWSFDPDGINLPILKVFGENSAGKPVQPNIPKSDFLTFTVKYDTPLNGTITVSSSTENSIQSGAPVAGGTELIISATPNDGYELTSLNVNDNPFKSGDTYTVTGDVKISASFDVKPTPPDPDPVIPDPDPTPTLFQSVTLPQL